LAGSNAAGVEGWESATIGAPIPAPTSKIAATSAADRRARAIHDCLVERPPRRPVLINGTSFSGSGPARVNPDTAPARGFSELPEGDAATRADGAARCWRRRLHPAG
jgi:hypothetical protein